ncbi:DUF1642 domain-containing protein [Lactiplantibacillus plantarum]|uniref:DUF1642 domain-containing protein n=1 Tax=Lactiplantibacillus plantarum TaxID=1590 RepID=UPI003F530BBE
MKFYRKQPIEAEHFDGSDAMVDKYELIDAGTMLGTHHSPELYLTGSGKVDVGDRIATGVNGEHWAISDDVFKKTYAKLPVIPKAVATYIKKCKHDGIAIASAMSEKKFPKKVADYFRTYYTRDQWIKLQDTFARAWLDGYVVEEDE